MEDARAEIFHWFLQALNPNKTKTWSLDDNSKPDTRGYMGWGPRDDNSWGGTPAGMSRETHLPSLSLPKASLVNLHFRARMLLLENVRLVREFSSAFGFCSVLHP